MQLDLGVPFVLEPQDESPFMKFGYVYPGQTVPALYNNLVRAPLFRHKAKTTDFLVVRLVSHPLAYIMIDNTKQAYRQRRDKVFSERNQEPLRDWPNLPCNRGSWATFSQDNEYHQISPANNCI